MLKTLLVLLCCCTAHQVYGQTFKDLTDSAIAVEQQGKNALAIELYRKALKLDEGNLAIYNKIGLNYYQLGAYDSAITYANMTLAVAPQDSVALFQRGYATMELGDFAQAAKDFTASFEATGRRNPDASFNIGKSYAGLGTYDSAIAYYKRTLVLQPNDKYSYFELGYSYAMLSDKDSALLNYTRAIQQDSGYYQAYLNRGLLYYSQFQQLDMAHRDLERSIIIRPKNRYSYLYNGMIYHQEEDFGKADDMYDALIDHYPDFADAYYERATNWYSIGILNMVCRDLEKAEALGHPKAAETRAALCKEDK